MFEDGPSEDITLQWVKYRDAADECSLSRIYGGMEAVFGALDQRWVTGVGAYSGDTVSFNVELTSGGIFNGSDPLATHDINYGTITVKFISCTEAVLTYSFPSAGLSGQMTLTRLVGDNVALCEMLAEPWFCHADCAGYGLLNGTRSRQPNSWPRSAETRAWTRP